MSGVPFAIGVDWGTSSFRAWLLADDGAPLGAVHSASGITKVPNGDFAAVLREAIGGWRDAHPALPVMMCGMIGSRQGWQEAAYLSGSVSAEALAKGLMVLASDPGVRIVPGLMSAGGEAGLPDVMRGEETILVGAMAAEANPDGWYCLPGTHSKWVQVVSREIRGFSTYVTGESFELYRRHSIVGPLIAAQGEGPFDEARVPRGARSRWPRGRAAQSHLLAARRNAYGCFAEPGARRHAIRPDDRSRTFGAFVAAARGA